MWLLVIIPFYYTRTFRYYQGWKLLSFVFGEFLLSALFVFIDTSALNLTTFIATQLLFWSVYECGYLDNDCHAVKIEKQPTLRAPETIVSKFKFLIFTKLILASVIAYVCIKNELFSAIDSISILTVILATFFIHNRIQNPAKRCITVNLLGYFRYIFVIQIFDANIFLFSFLIVPLMVTRLLGYMHTKQLIEEDLRENIDFKFSLFSTWFVMIVLFVDPIYWSAYLLLYLNQNKKYFAYRVQALRRRASP